MNFQKGNLELSNVITVLIQLILDHIVSVYIVCLSLAALVTLSGVLSADGEAIGLVFILVIFIPLFAIVFSLKGLIILGLPSVLLFYRAKVRNKILWLLLGAAIGQASYYFFLPPSLLSSQTSDFNLLIIMPMAIGMLTGLKMQKRLYKNEPATNENIAAPIFKSIFGESWDDLPPVMQKHYALRPYSDDVITVKGRLDVMCKAPLKYLGFLVRLMGQIPPANEKDVPVTVEFKADKNSSAFHFIRSFHFKDSKPYVFHSRMVQIKDNVVAEIMRFGLCWLMTYHWDGDKVVLKHKGYAWHALGIYIPLPLTLLMGAGYAEEHVVDEQVFDMFTHITHPWWGKVYEYKGQFEMK